MPHVYIHVLTLSYSRLHFSWAHNFLDIGQSRSSLSLSLSCELQITTRRFYRQLTQQTLECDGTIHDHDSFAFHSSDKQFLWGSQGEVRLSEDFKCPHCPVCLDLLYFLRSMEQLPEGFNVAEVDLLTDSLILYQLLG